jgi:Asp-tRNA(Asn)/Glu-tRNA(Gln) amidotransferase A subunit family amidase
MDILAAPLRAVAPLGRVHAAWRDAGVPAPRPRIAVIADDPVAEVVASVREQFARLVKRWDLLICPVATTAAFKQNQQGFRW